MTIFSEMSKVVNHIVVVVISFLIVSSILISCSFCFIKSNIIFNLFSLRNINILSGFLYFYGNSLLENTEYSLYTEYSRPRDCKWPIRDFVIGAPEFRHWKLRYFLKNPEASASEFLQSLENLFLVNTYIVYSIVFLHI